MQEEIFLSVIIPAYNEEKRLPKTLEAIFSYLSQQTYSWEILVVSDGSTDGTVSAVRELGQRIPNLRIIDNKKNYGKGYVVRQGMLEARGKHRLFADADNSTSVDQTEKMWSEFEKGYDVVIGSRDVRGAVLDPPQGWKRRFLGEGFKLVRKILVGLWGVQDTQCGFKCFSAGSAKDIFSLVQLNRWAFDVEALVLAKKLNYKIKEIPVIWVNDPNSKVKISGMIKMIFEMMQVRWNMLRGKYSSRYAEHK